MASSNLDDSFLFVWKVERRCRDGITSSAQIKYLTYCIHTETQHLTSLPPSLPQTFDSDETPPCSFSSLVYLFKPPLKPPVYRLLASRVERPFVVLTDLFCVDLPVYVSALF